MSTHEYDAVVGGGVWNHSLPEAYSCGFKTALISRGDPACCLSTGCIDVFSRTDSPDVSGVCCQSTCNSW